MNELRTAILKRLREAGHSSVTEFADAWPGLPLHALASKLGGVSGIQLELCLSEEARESGTIQRFAKDYLVRCLRWMLERGWGNGPDAEFDAASAYAHWASGLGERAAAAAEAAFRRLRSLNVPVGWLPVGPDDPYIEAAFEGVSFDAAAT
jgi:hypothetical protein